jgi:GNAT superfamily N-acetyltransferase
MVEVTAATETDVPAIAALLEEMDRFYGVMEFEPAPERERQIRSLLLGERPAGCVLLAHEGERLVGLASYSFLWPAAGLTQSLFLKELYVTEAERSRGVGRRLMERVFAIAAETGCSRVEWMTERSNVEAQAFYERLGYEENKEKVLYRVGHSKATS